jgi:hypothetical protein
VPRGKNEEREHKYPGNGGSGNPRLGRWTRRLARILMPVVAVPYHPEAETNQHQRPEPHSDRPRIEVGQDIRQQKGNAHRDQQDGARE